MGIYNYIHSFTDNYIVEYIYIDNCIAEYMHR